MSVVVGVIGTLVTTGFLVADRIGGADDPPAPKVLGARLSSVRATADVTLRDYLARTRRLERFVRNSRAAGLTDEERREMLGTNGVEVGYDLRILGPPGRRVSVLGTLFRAGRARPVPSTGLEQRTTYVSEAATDALSDRLWMPLPPASGRYTAQVDVVDGRGNPVASRTTGAFAVSGSR